MATSRRKPMESEKGKSKKGSNLTDHVLHQYVHLTHLILKKHN